MHGEPPLAALVLLLLLIVAAVALLLQPWWARRRHAQLSRQPFPRAWAHILRRRVPLARAPRPPR